MAKWRLVAAAAGVLAAFVAVPAEAGGDICIKDPTFVAVTPSGISVTLHLTIYGNGSVNYQAVQAAQITGLSEKLAGQFDNVTLTAYTPNGPAGVFQVNYVVSTQPFGGGTVLHQVSSHSGIYQSMTFVLPYL